MSEQHRREGRPNCNTLSTQAVRAFIVENLHLKSAPTLSEIMLYAAHPGSRLSRLVSGEAEDTPPYWAYNWAGGTLLAHYLLEHPDVVRNRRVLDLGAGSGVVGIVA